MSSRLESLYRALVFVAFALTAWFAVPGIFWPHAVLDVLGIPVPRQLVWTAFAFQLALLVSLYTLPVMLDWQRYLFNAWLLGCSHVAWAIYWWLVYPWQSGFTAWTLGWCEALLGVALLCLLGWLWKQANGPVITAVITPAKESAR